MKNLFKISINIFFFGIAAVLTINKKLIFIKLN